MTHEEWQLSVFEAIKNDFIRLGATKPVATRNTYSLTIGSGNDSRILTLSMWQQFTKDEPEIDLSIYDEATENMYCDFAETFEGVKYMWEILRPIIELAVKGMNSEV